MAWGVMQEWAVAETKQRNFAEARRLFLKALTLEPRHIPAIGGLAHAESLAGELHSARNLYARALKVGALIAKSVHRFQHAWLLLMDCMRSCTTSSVLVQVV